MSISTVAISGQTASFNLIDVDIRQAALALQHHTGLPVTLERKVTGSISLVSKKPLDASGAVILLAAIAREKGWYPEIGAQGGLTIRATPLPIGDLMNGSVVTFKYPILYRTATEASSHLRKLLSPRGSIGAVDDRAVLIHDEQRVHQRIFQALVEIDVESSADTLHAKLQFAQAVDVADALHRLAASTSEPRLAIAQADMPSNSLVWQSSEPLWDERLRNMIASFDQDAKLVATLSAASLPPVIKLALDAHVSENKALCESPAMRLTTPAVQPKNNAISAGREVEIAMADWSARGARTDFIGQFCAPLLQDNVRKGQCIQSLVPPTSYREHTDAWCARDASAFGSNAGRTEGLSLKMTQQLSQFGDSPPQ